MLPVELMSSGSAIRVAVVIPCFRVKRHIMDVLDAIPAYVARVYVVDDACPEGTADWVEGRCADQRVVVLRNKKNLGVGGAVVAGYSQGLIDGVDVLVKIDGDGQMDLDSLSDLIGPILDGEADYCKGNRFYDLEQIGRMPPVRILGNAALSFLNKMSTGYWDVFDPTNGYTAIHARVLRRIPLCKLSARYFFESDLLFRLSIIRAVVVDVPMDARYGDEVSNLRIRSVFFNFAAGHLVNAAKRVFYSYFLRDLSLASIQLCLGCFFCFSSLMLGVFYWMRSAQSGVFTPAGSVTLVALQAIVGLLLLQGFLAHDIASVPRRAVHRLLGPRGSRRP